MVVVGQAGSPMGSTGRFAEWGGIMVDIEAQDRIEILKLMHESGKLHAQLILE